MAAVRESADQCVIWFGTPLQQEKDALAAAGWQVRVAEPGSHARVGLRAADTVVGMVDLRSMGPEALRGLEQLASDLTLLSLVAIVPPRRPDSDAAGALLERCSETLPAPVDTTRLIRALDGLRGQQFMPRGRGIDAVIGRSPVMRKTQAAIRKYAPVDLPVLITGQTGTGKEVAARALHELSPRHARPFMAVNCGALPANLLQSELFGHERGAFTGATARRAGLFESANGGTVFLDEIGDLPLEAQTNLLRVLQESSLERVGSNQPIAVDVRVLAATNVDLEAAVASGRFRSDLYYRLNVLRLQMPRLADRGEDIPLLATHFLETFRGKHPGRARGFSASARRAMARFEWPGNVRELLNRVQRAAVVAESELITAQDMELPVTDVAANDGGLDSAREVAEHDAVLTCLKESDFNVSEVARRLKVSRVTVYRLCKKHSLALDELR
ncbi:sigma-54 interaction domain-containing protein [Novilysobacter spongiicola]|uniref:DNA-binding transcriptional response regulator, NtrC family, contains REC, AAA-type ATPase, and a Fis-type DNA-binding domains n=1 Tax=Lysobacter spongiicola DSM 21749 TaxID=1122188 RepID=A0A1T4Q2D6_9GAMM|nr:sigma-54 dependent transcriptional regulator [Lysobacter spongiicola]SJZ97671.1 DNA-binding transcriptional response regulator, NtrC family, contains REC, AAA-type ATPase, and a Fis-type DNA-binding domains [Lysobacter spongiicola DSM 21749]